MLATRRQQLEEALISDLALLLNTPQVAFTITGLRLGSLVVDFLVNMDLTQTSSTAIADILGRTVVNSQDSNSLGDTFGETRLLYQEVNQTSNLLLRSGVVLSAPTNPSTPAPSGGPQSAPPPGGVDDGEGGAKCGSPCILGIIVAGAAVVIAIAGAIIYRRHKRGEKKRAVRREDAAEAAEMVQIALEKEREKKKQKAENGDSDTEFDGLGAKETLATEDDSSRRVSNPGVDEALIRKYSSQLNSLASSSRRDSADAQQNLPAPLSDEVQSPAPLTSPNNRFRQRRSEERSEAPEEGGTVTSPKEAGKVSSPEKQAEFGSDSSRPPLTPRGSKSIVSSHERSTGKLQQLGLNEDHQAITSPKAFPTPLSVTTNPPASYRQEHVVVRTTHTSAMDEINIDFGDEDDGDRAKNREENSDGLYSNPSPTHSGHSSDDPLALLPDS